MSFCLLQNLLAGDLLTLLLVLTVTQTGGFLLDLRAEASLSFLPSGLFLAMAAGGAGG